MLLGRVAGRWVAGRRGVRVVVVCPRGGRGLHRFSRRVRGGSWLLLRLLARVARRQRVDELIGTHRLRGVALLVTVPIAPHLHGSASTGTPEHRSFTARPLSPSSLGSGRLRALLVKYRVASSCRWSHGDSGGMSQYNRHGSYGYTEGTQKRTLSRGSGATGSHLSRLFTRG